MRASIISAVVGLGFVWASQSVTLAQTTGPLDRVGQNQQMGRLVDQREQARYEGPLDRKIERSFTPVRTVNHVETGENQPGAWPASNTPLNESVTELATRVRSRLQPIPGLPGHDSQTKGFIPQLASPEVAERPAIDLSPRPEVPERPEVEDHLALQDESGVAFGGLAAARPDSRFLLLADTQPAAAKSIVFRSDYPQQDSVQPSPSDQIANQWQQDPRTSPRPDVGNAQQDVFLPYTDGVAFGHDLKRLYHPLEGPTTRLFGAPTVDPGFGVPYCDEWAGHCRIRNLNYVCPCDDCGTCGTCSPCCRNGWGAWSGFRR